MRLTIITCLFFSVAANAQTDSSVVLHDVEITDTRLSSFNSGLNEQVFDSAILIQYQHLSLSDLLTENSAIYVKNYGPGQISTITLRGGSANHTAIVWNGFSLNSPLLGQTDLSLENNFFFDDVRIQYGGTSTLWGSGAIDGTIHLENRSAFNSGLKVKAGFTEGSFSNHTQLAGISWGGKKYYGSLKFIHNNNKNNFTYYNPNTNHEEEQINSSVKHFGIFNENFFQTGMNSILTANIWYSDYDRQVPPSLFQFNSHSNQKDINGRYSLSWKLAKQNNAFTIRTAYFNEVLEFDDLSLKETSANKCKSFNSEATFDKKIKNHFFEAGINNTYSFADSTQYVDETDVNRLAIFLLYKYQKNQQTGFTASVRKEYSSLQNSPLVYSAGMNLAIIKSITMLLYGSKFYRNPTINDLYWHPGGNADLKPESGYSAEAGLKIDISKLCGIKSVKHVLGLYPTIYYKNVDDWIIWYPTSSSIVWGPQNLLNVKSKGLELTFNYKFIGRKITTGVDMNYFYTESTNEKPLYSNDASLHQQLIYTPVYRWNTVLHFSYHGYSVHYNHSYTGRRYTTSDNTEYLKPYSIDNIQFDKTLNFKILQIVCFFKVRNLFDTEYQSVVSRPMSLRSFEGGLTFTFTKINSK